ncbi:unnamed protein product, partial [Closterium sp. NIES-54]
MASLSVLTFDAEGRAVDFEVWLDDLQLFLQCDSKDGLSLFDLTSGASTAPAADADSTVRSQWTTRDAAARLAVRSHLPSTERVHFSQYKSAQTLYDAEVTRYSSPATAALSRLMLPYLFPDLAAFATVADLVAHLRTSDTRYRAALPTAFLPMNSPPMHINRLPDSLSSVKDHFLSLCPTELTVDLLEERLAAAEKSILAIGASRGDSRTPFFEGCSLVPLLPSLRASARRSRFRPPRSKMGFLSAALAWSWTSLYAAHQINLQPRVSLPETTPTQRWTGKVGDASAFRVWGSRAFVHDTTADKLCSRAVPCVFLGFPPDAPGWQFYHPTSCYVLSGRHVRRGPAPSGVSQVDPAEPVEVAVDSGATGGAESGGAESGGAATGGVAPEGAVSGGAETAHAESGGALGVPSRREPLSPLRLREWYSRRCRVAPGAAGAEAGGAAGGGATGGGAGAGAAGGATEVTCSPPPFLSPPPIQSHLQPASPLPGPSPYSGPTRGLMERREPESRPLSPVSRSASPVRTVRASRVSRPRPPPIPGTHYMTLRPSTAPQRVPLPSPRASSLTTGLDPTSDSLRAACPAITRFLATAVSDPLFESTAASALVTELVDFAAACRLDYATSLVAEFASVRPPSFGGECALGTDVLEDRKEDLECFSAASPHLVFMLLAPEGDPDALDIPTPRSYAEAIEGPYSSQWQAAMDAEMASWKSTGTYVDKVPPPGANIELHSLDFSTAFLQGSLQEEIWLRRPPGFSGSFPPGTQWSLQRPVYGLRQAPREWHNTPRTTLAALGFAPSTADPSLFLRTNTTLLLFYVLVYVDDLVFATADTEALAHVKHELQKRHTCTDLGELTSYLGLRITRDRAQRTITLTQSHMVQQVLQRFGFTYSSPQSTPVPIGHSLSAPPLDESVEPSGSYPELVGCL